MSACPNEDPVKDGCLKKWALLSGGKDSVTVAHVLDQRKELEGCLTIDTGISTDDWMPFIKDLCDEQGWPLVVVKTPLSYESLVQRYGFPGPDMHRVYFSALKGRGVRLFKKQHPNAVLASGVRKHESARRFRNVEAGGTFEGLRVVAPIADWRTERVWAYMHQNGLRRSPAYETVGMSGDCLCGAYASPTEKTLIEVFYPTVARRIASIEKTMAGGKKPATWGWGAGGMGFDMATRQTTLEAVACESCAVDAMAGAEWYPPLPPELVEPVAKAERIMEGEP